MSSIRQQILDHVMTLLGDPGAPTANVNRTRLEQFSPDELAAGGAYNLFPMDEDAPVFNNDDAERIFKFRLVMLASAPKEADKAIDPLYVFAVEKVAEDRTFAGLCRYVYERASTWTVEQGDQDIVSLSVDFEAQFVTDPDDPTISNS